MDVSQTTDAAFYGVEDRLGSDHRFDDAFAADCFFQQVEGFCDAASVRSQAASGDGAPNVFEEGILGTRKFRRHAQGIRRVC
jgi:hypothetical protein